MKKIISTMLAVMLLVCLTLTACGEKFTVTFTVDGETYKTVETKGVVEKPEDPEKAGYTFEGWKLGKADFDFSKEIESDITLKAEFKAKSDTPYTVRVFAEQQGGTYLEITDNVPTVQGLKGTTDTEIKVEYLTLQAWGLDKLTGYSWNKSHPDSVLEGTVKADGSLELKVYMRLMGE